MGIECGECERDLRGGHDWDCTRNNPCRVRLKNADESGLRVGGDVIVDGLVWVPVLWDDEDHPSLTIATNLEFVTPIMPQEINIACESGSVEVDVDHDKKLVNMTWQIDERVRITRFPLFLVADICALILREANVSTFQYSAKSGRVRIATKPGTSCLDLTNVSADWSS